MQPDDVIGRRRILAVALGLFATVAAVPLFGTVDAGLDTMLDAWRSCTGEAIATLVSDLVGPIGVAVLFAVVLRSLWLGRPAPLEMVGVLVAMGVGVGLVGELKEFLDRPRPGAELFGSGGASFPSGHVGNTMVVGIAVLALWSGGWPRRPGLGGWLLLTAVTVVVGVARVYGRRHWPSDVVGTAALAAGYGLLAMLHVDRRWRVGVTVAAFVVLGLVHAAYRRGITLAIPAGTVASRRAPVRRIDFGSAFDTGLLDGTWSPDQTDRSHHSVWLRSPTGKLGLGPVQTPVSELRFVLRPRTADGDGSCRRLVVTLNGRVLGERLLQAGWRSYVFPASASDFESAGNVLTLEVRGEASEPGRVGERRAAFSELTLHAAMSGSHDPATRSSSGPPLPRRVLAEVAHVASVVLGEPIARVLHEMAVEKPVVANFHASDALNHPRDVTSEQTRRRAAAADPRRAWPAQEVDRAPLDRSAERGR